LKNELSHPYAKEFSNKIDDNFMHQTFYKTLDGFNKQFRVWLSELSRNQIKFAPFAIKPEINTKNEITDFSIGTESIFTLVNGKPERKNKFNIFAKKNYELFIAHLNKSSEKVGDAPDTTKRFMAVFSEGINELVN
jgi:hypothetical protein